MINKYSESITKPADGGHPPQTKAKNITPHDSTASNKKQNPHYLQYAR